MDWNFIISHLHDVIRCGHKLGCRWQFRSKTVLTKKSARQLLILLKTISSTI